ncbi:hypothetical protein [Rhizobium ruizarguesonis]|nr:hypothetical protein [Rhizobium ruizarguesonis]
MSDGFEITFEPRWAPFPEAGVQFLLADLWRKWVIDEAVNPSIG